MQRVLLKVIFYICLILIFYTYIIFPICLYILELLFLKRRTNEEENNSDYSVAIICAMYNEERVVKEKLENFYKIKYDNLKIYIGSDGSSDKTNEILDSYSYDPNIKVFKFSRRGKVHVINDLIREVNEEIIVFTDANSMFDSNAVVHLVKHFKNQNIGVVCGNLKLMNSGQITGEGFYWRYENWIKSLENQINCVIGANGGIYAIRRSLLRPLPTTTINDDFTNSMRVMELGYGIKYEKNAIAYEEINHSDDVEFKRHIRDGAGHFRAIIHLYKLLNPFNFKVFLLYMSHRVIRWIVPFFLVITLLLPYFIGVEDFNYMDYGIVFCQLIFYFLALIGFVTKTKIKIFYIPMYFLYINFAILIGFIKNLLGVQKVTWNSTER